MVFALDRLNRHLRELEDSSTDLGNYDSHIEIVRGDLRALLNDHARRIETALAELSAALPEKEPTDYDLRRLSDTLRTFSRILSEPNDWRRLRQVPTPKTNIVEALGLQPISQDKDGPVLPDPLKSIEDITTTVKRQELKDALTDQIAKVKLAELVTYFENSHAKVDRALTDLQRRVKELRSQKDAEAQAVRPDVLFMQEQIAQSSGGQESTFKLVGYMMGLLLLLFAMSIVARLTVAIKFGNTSYSGIIDEKTLIEFGGMAFILLTIIILGNTERLDRQALGALLGTIAGYIFGKGIVAAGVSTAAHTSMKSMGGDAVSPVIKAVVAKEAELMISGDQLSPAANIVVFLAGSRVPVSGRTAYDTYSLGSMPFAHRLIVTLPAAPQSNTPIRLQVTNPDGGMTNWEGTI